jgi:protocatechuate 3,4-dioxygenase beta subunit
MEGDFNGRDWSLHPAYIHPPYKSTVARGPTKPLVSFEQTLSERTGPTYGGEAMLPLDADLTKSGAHGERMRHNLDAARGLPLAEAAVFELA